MGVGWVAASPVGLALWLLPKEAKRKKRFPGSRRARLRVSPAHRQLQIRVRFPLSPFPHLALHYATAIQMVTMLHHGEKRLTTPSTSVRAHAHTHLHIHIQERKFIIINRFLCRFHPLRPLCAPVFPYLILSFFPNHIN